MAKFIINGGNSLSGKLKIGGSKNAALPILAATMLTDQKCILENVPDISDIHSMLKIMETLGSSYSFKNNRIEIQTAKIISTQLPKEHVKTFRASILFLGSLLSRAGEIKMYFPGGCVLGRRSISAHLYAIGELGGQIINSIDYLEIKASEIIGNDFTMFEPSVTATENAIILAVLAKGKSIIRLTATEPHIQDLCHFLNKCGAKINGIGSPCLEIEGVEKLNGCEHRVTSDYLEAGTFAIAAATNPGSEVLLTDVNWHDLDAFWNKLKQTGVKLEFGEDKVKIWGNSKFNAISKLDTRLYPYFPTDLQAPFSVLLTQANGVSKIFETLFEGRLSYLFELEKMGAKIEILNPHQAIIIGPTSLKGSAVASCDIRAGAAVILAGLIAKGETEISNINYIDRGHEKIEERLRAIGADIQRID